jgi:hypothetical protein
VITETRVRTLARQDVAFLLSLKFQLEARSGHMPLLSERQQFRLWEFTNLDVRIGIKRFELAGEPVLVLLTAHHPLEADFLVNVPYLEGVGRTVGRARPRPHWVDRCQ